MSYTAVQNRFWSDGWVRGLNALDRYLFLYLLTNGRAQLTGIYELPLDLMASESGIDEKDLRLSMLQRLEPKVYYKEGWIIIKNYPNHRVSNSPKLMAGIRNAFGELPKKIQEIARSCGYPIDTLSIHIDVSLNRIDKNRTYTSEVKTSPKYTYLPEGKEETRVKPKPKYPNAKVVFGWFSCPEKSWEINTTELKHAELLFERGEEQVKKALVFVKENRDDEFFPKVVKPSDLERKWEDILIFKKRNK